VKTHIANMLVKTGTRDRRELAAWDGRPAEASRRLGRGFALPLAGWSAGAKVAGGVVAAAVFLGAVWVVFEGLGGDEQTSTGSVWTLAAGGLYLEATREFSWAGLRSQSSGAAPEASAQPRVDMDRVEQFRLWWNGRDEWRAELTSQSSRVYGSEHRIVVGNDDRVSQYDVLRNTVSETPASEFWERYFIPWVFPILPALDGHESINDYLEHLSTHPDRGIREVDRTHAGTTMHLGRTVEVIEGSDGRTLIEPDAMLTVLIESPGFRFEVTDLQTGAIFDPQLFVFDPPSDAGEIARGGPAGTGCAPGPGVAPAAFAEIPGFLVPEFIPDGWEARGGGSGRSGGPWQPHCDIWNVSAHLVPEEGEGYVWVEQLNLLHIPARLQRGTPVDVGGHEGYRITQDGLERLVWAQDGVVAMIEGDVLPFEELLRIAESAEVVR
jgi:hypothetical protein